MNKTKTIFYFCLVILLLFNFALAGLIEKSGIDEKDKTNKLTIANNPSSLVPEKTSSPKSASYILVTDVLDGFGGQRYNGGCDLSIFAGGQSSPVGTSNSPNFELQAGFVYSAVVKCGDANADGTIGLGDVVYLISYLYKNGPPPDPYQAGETNCLEEINIGDVVYLIGFLYKGGPAPIC